MDRPVSMVPVSTIRVGDVVLCSDGIERTVCKRNLKKRVLWVYHIWR